VFTVPGSSSVITVPVIASATISETSITGLVPGIGGATVSVYEAYSPSAGE
jgi:hypothetical protein